ncbi:MAG: TonB-dependent receptor [Ferruginibacter sp.]
MKKIILVQVLLCFAVYIQAQEKAADTSDSGLNKIILDEVSISATRFATAKKFIPQKVLTISAKKNSFYNQQTTAEMLTHSGSVLVQKSQLGGGSPIVRGFEANKVLLVVDGVRMNNAIFRGGHLQNVITLDNAILEKTEILLGSSSVMYGSDALGGVISFYTKKPALSQSSDKIIFTGNAFVRYASAYNEKSGHMDISVAGNKIGSITSFTYTDLGYLKQGASYYDKFPNWGKRTFYVVRINGIDSMVKNNNVNKQTPTGYKQYDLLQKFLFKTGKVEHVLNFQYSTSADINRYDRLTETTGAGIAKSAEWYYGPQKRLLAAWTVNPGRTAIYDQAQIATAYQQVEESRHNRNFRSIKLNHREEQVKIGSVNADFLKKVKKFELGYGAELIYNKVNSSAYAENISTGAESPLDTRYPDGGSNSESYAAYATGLYKLSGKLIVNGGLRFTHNRLYSKFNDTSFFPFPYKDIEQSSSSITGTAGIVYLPAEGWKISGLVSTGFRTPNVDDMAKVFESSGGTLIVPNPDIDPEKTINYELGISKKIKNMLEISATAWYTDYHDVLTTAFSTFNGSGIVIYDGTASQVVTIVNKNKAYLWGISGNLDASIGGHFTFSSVINYTYGRIKEEPKDYPLDHVSPLFGKTSVLARFGKLSGEVFALYSAAKDSADYNLRGEDNQVYSADIVHGYTPSYITLNLRTACEINRYATIQFAVENIFDKYYRVFASGLSGPGRNFVLTLRARL